MAESNTHAGLKCKIVELYGSEEVAVNDIILELFPNYCKLKLPHLQIISAGLKTNEIGKEISKKLDTISKSSNNNWSNYH